MTLLERVADLGIPTLSAVLNPTELGRHLELFSLPPWRWGDPRDVRVEVLKCRAGSRCTVEIVLRTANGEHALVGKVYVSDGVDVYHAMKQISEAGFGPESEFSIPQPLAFLDMNDHLIWINRKIGKAHWRERIETALDEVLRSLTGLLGFILLLRPELIEALKETSIGVLDAI